MVKRVLIAEDELNIATSLTFLLERAGYSVSVVSDGPDALREVLDDPPDALVLDLMLPGMDGYEILRGIRSDAKSRDVPVLILTAKGQKEYRDTADALGATAFITKPFANADLLKTVTRLAGPAS